jgi:hypothetical protein
MEGQMTMTWSLAVRHRRVNPPWISPNFPGPIPKRRALIKNLINLGLMFFAQEESSEDK